MTRPVHRVRPPTRPALIAIMLSLTIAAWSTGCGGGGDTVAVDPDPPTTAEPITTLGEFSDAYCERAEQLSGAGELRLDGEPGRAAAAMETLAAEAPPALSDDVAVVTDQLARFGDLGADPSDALEVIDLLIDPDFLAALDRVERATFEQCGVRLDAVGDGDTGSTP